MDLFYFLLSLPRYKRLYFLLFFAAVIALPICVLAYGHVPELNILCAGVIAGWLVIAVSLARAAVRFQSQLNLADARNLCLVPVITAASQLQLTGPVDGTEGKS